MSLQNPNPVNPKKAKRAAFDGAVIAVALRSTAMGDLIP
jgi:hypothetical protein